MEKTKTAAAMAGELRAEAERLELRAAGMRAVADAMHPGTRKSPPKRAPRAARNGTGR